MAKDEIEYGTEVKDTLTGFKGKVIGFATYWEHGADTFLVASCDTTGYLTQQWVDADRLEIVR